MYIIKSKSSEAYINIATEEFLFENIKENIFYLYQNDKSIIIGRKQNTLAEINLDYVKSHNIPVVRRLSGGGAVFHDKGNLNFCFIIRDCNSFENDFSKYTQPIIDLLVSLGVNAKLEGRNDLLIDGKKFSGNAKYFKQSTLLQHGTLLFDSNISDISQALNADPMKFTDKAIKSVRSRVTNISEHLNMPLSLPEFEELLINKILSIYNDAKVYDLSENDTQIINKLVEDKYNNWDWNYGHSPQYDFYKKVKTEGGLLEIALNVKNGKITKFKLYGDFFTKQDTDTFEGFFIGKTHSMEELIPLLHSVDLNNIFVNIHVNDFVQALF